MYLAYTKIVSTPANRPQVMEILQSMLFSTRGIPGCIDCGIYEGCEENRSLVYVELWRSREGMHQHIRSREYLRVLTAMELASEKPEVSFLGIDDHQGLELVDSLRGGGD